MLAGVYIVTFANQQPYDLQRNNVEADNRHQNDSEDTYP